MIPWQEKLPYSVPWPAKMPDTIDGLCDEYDIKLALDSANNTPEEMAQVCRNRSKRIGVHGDVASWMQRGIDPTKAIQTLGQRLVTLQIDPSDESDNVLAHIGTLRVVPVMFAGPGIQKRSVGRPVGPQDIAPTLSAWFGIKPPSGSVGSPLTEIVR